MDCVLHVVAKSQTQVSDFHFHFSPLLLGVTSGKIKIHLPMQEVQETQVRSPSREDLREEEMSPHSSLLAWEIP